MRESTTGPRQPPQRQRDDERAPRDAGTRPAGTRPDDERPHPNFSLDPWDAALEWRRLFAELLGTFLLTLAATGGAVIGAATHHPIAEPARVVAPGLLVMAMIYTLGGVSGAHLNPAVTFAFAIRRDFPWHRVPGYWLAQLGGAVLAAALLRALFGDVAHLGATRPAPGLGTLPAVVTELALTGMLVTVILGTAHRSRILGPNAAIAVGGTIALAGLIAAPATGALLRPGARRRRPRHVLDLPRRAAGGRAAGRRLRLDPQRPDQSQRAPGRHRLVSACARSTTRGLAERLAGTSFRFLREDCRRTSLPDAAVEVVVYRMLLHHIERIAEALDVVRRVLRAGGALVIRDGRRLPDADAQAMAAELARHGLPSEVHPRLDPGALAVTLEGLGFTVKELLDDGEATFATPPYTTKVYGTRAFLVLAERGTFPR